MTELAATFRRPFNAQIAAFRLRLGTRLPTRAWDDLWQDQHDRAFVVAGAMKAELLSDLGQAVDKAIAQGTSLQEFRKDFRSIVDSHGWHGWTGDDTAAGRAWRTRVIYRTNMRTSYMAGRFAQLVEGGFKYWVYRHGGAREPRLHHLAWDGIALPPDHPFWALHFPPNGWGCSCIVFGANSEAAVRRRGGDPDKRLPDNWEGTDPKTGAPVGIDRGWAYAPGAGVVDTVRLGAELLSRMDAKPPAIDFGQSLAPLVDRAWPMWVADTLAKGSHGPALAGTLSRDVVDALKPHAVSPISPEILVQPGLLVGPKADRHENKGDALSLDAWLGFPAALRTPLAVLLDTENGALLYLMADLAGTGQAAVRLNYRLKKSDPANVVVSAYRPSIAEVRRRVSRGALIPLIGDLR